MADYRQLLETLGTDQFNRLARVLESVVRYGSLNRATGALGISYRAAWGLLRKAEDQLKLPLLTRRTGGAEGGGAELTDAALDLLRRHSFIKSETEQILSGPDTTTERHQPVSTPASIHGEPRGMAPPVPRPVLIASTIGPVEVGLLDALEGAFHAATGLWARHIAAGTGQALELGRSGRADLLLVHAPEEEERFVAQGWGERRYPLMSNDFVIAGPVEDPAGIGGSGSAPAALRRVSETQSPFLSRGDRSGTHLKELFLWQAAGVEPHKAWYRVFDRGGQGSGITLREADRSGAYTLVDRATFAAGSPGRLAALMAGDPLLHNPFSLVTLSPGRFSELNHEGARSFVSWATGPEGQRIIAGSEHFVPFS